MTLSKKSSRRIVVNEVNYRWTISPSSDYVVLIAEFEGVKGRRLEVKIQTDINSFWINFPEVSDLNLKIVYPKEVAIIISTAIKQGWDPYEKGSPLRFELSSNNVLKRIFN